MGLRDKDRRASFDIMFIIVRRPKRNWTQCTVNIEQ